MSTDTQTQTAEVASTQTPRTFYRSDYKRMASTIQRMRHVQGDRYTAKAGQTAIDSMAVAVAQEFFLDAESHPEGPSFSPEKFLASTQLPARPSYLTEDAHLEAEYEDGVTGVE